MHEDKARLRANKISANRGASKPHRLASFNPRCSPLLTRLWLALAVAAFSCWVGYAAADSSPSAAPPIKIAVFAFELEDFSAAGQGGTSGSETSYLAEATDQAVQQLSTSGRYAVIDAVHSDISAAKGQGLRNCNGCEAPIALGLGADQALIGVITRISRTEYAVRLRVTNARNGDLISTYSTDLRMGADYSWSRGVRWLVQNRLLAAQ